MGLEMDRIQRLFVGAALPALFLALTLVPWLVARGDLPSPIAIHFGGHGTADGSAPVWLHLLLVATFTVPAALALLWAAWRRTSMVGAIAPVATFLGGLLGGLNLVVLRANEGAARWQTVTLGTGTVLATVVAALGAALLVARMVRHRGPERAVVLRLSPPPEISARSSWVGETSSRVVAVSAVCFALVAALVLVTAGGAGLATAVVLLASGLVMAAFISVRVGVAGTGVLVASGFLGWPRVRFGLDEIEAARCVDWHPMTGGLVSGWGYRGSLRLLGRAAGCSGAGPPSSSTSPGAAASSSRWMAPRRRPPSSTASCTAGRRPPSDRGGRGGSARVGGHDHPATGLMTSNPRASAAGICWRSKVR